jgi:hypothetical protein
MATNIERKTIEASEGHILTNGKVYGRVITLSIRSKEEDFYEITEEEYNRLFSEDESEQVTEEDFIDALNEMGVKI